VFCLTISNRLRAAQPTWPPELLSLFHRAATFVFLLIALNGPMSTGQTSAPEVVIRSLDKPGSIDIVNVSASTVSLRGKLIVERKRGSGWIETPIVFQTIVACDGTDAPECVSLAPGATIHPVAWNGYTCSGQCTRPCRSNHYNGPGDFRFIVQSCDRTRRYTSEPFHLGPEPTTP
jgi:hypothetical protein